MNKQEQIEVRIESQKRTAQAFQSLLESENGKLVLEALSVMCNENVPTYIDQNPNGSAYKEGQRSIILGIRNQLKKQVIESKQKEAVVWTKEMGQLNQ